VLVPRAGLDQPCDAVLSGHDNSNALIQFLRPPENACAHRFP
jgi:hypothetical protein